MIVAAYQVKNQFEGIIAFENERKQRAASRPKHSSGGRRR